MKNMEISNELRELALKFIESPEMVDHLREDKLSINDIIEIILYSRAPLEDKAIAIQFAYIELARYNANQASIPESEDEWDKEYYRKKEIMLNKAIQIIDFALNEITGNFPPGTIFLLSGYSYGKRDSANFHWDCIPCTSFESARKLLKEDTQENREVYGNDNVDTDCKMYIIEKWLPDGNGEMKNIVTWLVSNEGVVWFADINEDFNHDLKQLTNGARYFIGWGDHSITRISVPFKQGDIVTIDNRPSRPVSHAVISSFLDGYWRYDCCGISAIYLNEDGLLEESALKHDLFGSPMFSCMLRLSKFIGELPEEEAILNLVSERLKQNPELANDDEFPQRIMDEWKKIKNTI